MIVCFLCKCLYITHTTTI